MNTNESKIDIVLTWVDDTDPQWVLERNKYYALEHEGKMTDFKIRYRDWENLKYVFRGIEKFMPWINTVHFVTWGHIPKWLDVTNPKLNIVRHEEFMPKEYIPTFNSSAIQVNLFRIPGLAEQYINFNDDMFVVRPTQKEDFFRNGLPCDMGCISPQPIKRELIYSVEFNNLKIINSYFSPNDIMKNKSKWLCPVLYGKFALRTFLFMHFSTIIGVFEQHIPFSYLKSEVQQVWEKEFEELDKTSRHKFRNVEDLNEWLFRMWQLFKGKFIPRSYRFGKLISASNIDALEHYMADKNCKLLCINDDASVVDFDKTKKMVNERLDRILPEKSSFEV